MRMRINFKKEWGLCAVMAFALSVGCGGAEEAAAPPEPEPETTAETPPPPPPKPTPPPEPTPPPTPSQETAEASYMEDTRWVQGSEGNLVMGLDGGEYPPYKPSVVKDFQSFLFEADMYDGPVTGVLDEETMHAIGRFQEEEDIVQSGVPSPETREAKRDRQAGITSSES